MKRSVKVLVSLSVIAVVFISLHAAVIAPKRVVPILMYHSISELEDSSMHVSPENFKRQMEFLDRRGYRVISLSDLVSGTLKGESFCSKTVVITFDDGFVDNYTEAFPILSGYELPATIFVVTDYVGRKGYLNWDQIRVMASGGIDIGSHTRSHAYLPSIENTEELWREVSGSRDDIRREIGRAPEHIAYPIGGFNDRVKNAVKMAGYRSACTTNRGYDRYNKDVFELNRVKVTNSDMTKPFNFRAKLSGYYNLFRSLRSPE